LVADYTALGAKKCPAPAGQCQKARGIYGQLTAIIRAVWLDSFPKTAYLPHEEQVGAAAAAHDEQLVEQQELWQRRWRWQQAEETLGNEAATTAKANTAILTSFMTNPPLTLGTKRSTKHCRPLIADPAAPGDCWRLRDAC